MLAQLTYLLARKKARCANIVLSFMLITAKIKYFNKLVMAKKKQNG